MLLSSTGHCTVVNRYASYYSAVSFVLSDVAKLFCAGVQTLRTVAGRNHQEATSEYASRSSGDSQQGV